MSVPALATLDLRSADAINGASQAAHGPRANAPSGRHATGLGDMSLTRQDVPRVAHTRLGDMTTRAPQPVATQTPDRTPWLLISVAALLAATAAAHHYRARRHRSTVTR